MSNTTNNELLDDTREFPACNGVSICWEDRDRASAWCKQHASGKFTANPVMDGSDIGMHFWYRFSEQELATAMRLAFKSP